MKEYEYKALEFRNELVDLLNKYKYNLMGLDDCNMQIVDYKNDKCFMLKSSYDDYEMLDFFNDNIMSKYILERFPESDNWIKPANKNVGIITNNYKKATDLFTQLEQEHLGKIVRFINSKERKELILDDNTFYKWVKPSDNSRGHRFRKVYIDKNITLDKLNNIILPICVYCLREDITVI